MSNKIKKILKKNTSKNSKNQIKLMQFFFLNFSENMKNLKMGLNDGFWILRGEVIRSNSLKIGFSIGIRGNN